MIEPARRHEFLYVQTDIPAGMTIHEGRAQRAESRPRGLRRAALAALGRLGPAAGSGARGLAKAMRACNARRPSAQQLRAADR
jgi:hypothetical protein